ncbi:hypothetical protein [Stenotrophomonas rhizophila]
MAPLTHFLRRVRGIIRQAWRSATLALGLNLLGQWALLYVAYMISAYLWEP